VSGKPRVLVELEEWDDTTDAIVWLIEERFKDVSLPELKIEEFPYTWEGIENLDEQRATLEGYRDNKGVRIYFEAEYTEIPAGKDEQGEDMYEDGFKITVEERYRYTPEGLKPTTAFEYIVEGTSRKNFKLVEEKTTEKKP